MIETKNHKNNNMYLIMIFPLLFVLLPIPNSSGLQSLTYPLLSVIMLFIGLRWYISEKINAKAYHVLLLLFFYAFAIGLSLVFAQRVSPSDFFQIAKPIYFAIILLFGLFVARKNDETSIIKGLLKASYIIILAQLVTGLAQLYDLSIFDKVYSDEKSRPLGRLMRIVGTTGNPNTFGWIVIQSAVIIILFEMKKMKKFIWIAIATLLLVLSGSRSMLLMLPVILISSILLSQRKNVKFYFVKIPFYAILTVLSFYTLIWFIKSYGDIFPYLNQLLVLLEGGSTLNSINSFDMRTIAWNEAIINYKENSGILTWLFGLGAGAYSVMDNAYLYAVINIGFVGLVAVLVIYIVLLFIFRKIKNTKIRALGYQYVLFSLILGYQADTISGWVYPTFALFYAGLSLAICEKQIGATKQGEVYIPQSATSEKVKKQRKRYKVVW